MTYNSSPTIQVVQTAEEIAALRGVWQEMQSHPTADVDLYLTLLESRREILRPHVIVLKQNDTPQSILVGRLEKKCLDIGFGYAKALLPTARCLTFIGGGPLGDNSEKSAAELVNSVEESLRNKEADVAWFQALDASSNVYEIVKKTGGMFSHDHFPVFNDHWKVRLPGTYAQFIGQRSANTRRNVKRYSKRLQDSFGDQIAIRCFRDPRQIESALADAESVACKTYHRGLQVGFTNNDETRRRMIHYACLGQLRAYTLYLAEKPIAFWNGFLYGRTFFTWTTGYDPDYSEFRPGLFLLQRLFEDICDEKVANSVDFGSGDAQYKRDWCDQNCREVSLYLFAPNFKGAFLNMLRTPLIACSQLARRGLARTGLLQGAKKLWRSRATRRAGVQPPND